MVFIKFYEKGIEFSSMEQYMMYGKAMCFHDETIAKQILQTDDVTRIKNLGVLYQTIMIKSGVECVR